MNIVGLTYEEEIRSPVAYVCFTRGHLSGSVEPDQDDGILLGIVYSHSILTLNSKNTVAKGLRPYQK